MFDEFRLKEALVSYKRDFAQKLWPNEKYKWQAVRCFQLNWDVNATDFAEMLKKSLSATANLLANVNNFPARMIQKFAEIVPVEVRTMFIELFDESKDVYERINNFKLKSSLLLERYGNGAAQHYQNENSISTYLWLRYPDKYYIFKLGEVKVVASELESDYRFKKGAYAENIRNFYAFYNEICAELQKDDELRNMLAAQVDSTCYADPEMRTLTIDVGFYISRYYSKRNDEPAVDEWWPTDYSPAISTDEWVALINDSEVFTPSSLAIMKRMLDYGGKATCTQLAAKYGETKNFYSSGSAALARRVAEKTGCPVMQRDTGDPRWWVILYVGRDEEGSFIWKLRDELSAALDKVDLSNVPLYVTSVSEVDVENLHSEARYKKWFSPVIDALRQLGGSASRPDVHKKIIEMCAISEEELKQKNQSGASTIINDIDWARNYLKYEGFLEKASTKGIWKLSSRGKSVQMTDELAEKIIAKWVRIKRCKRENLPIPTIDLSPYYTPWKQIKKYGEADFLSEVYMTEADYRKLQAVLRNKKNIILQGAPGVGKTFAAKRLAWAMMGEIDESRVEFVQFHQNYSYEDFVMGYKPVEDGFELRDGIFYRFCQQAAKQPNQDFFFIIDEINRGNMSKIFGELLMLIERDYRGTEVTLAYNGRPFSVPKNLYLIGMMNTADRSLAMIDYALRRRFSFFEMEPGFDSDGFRRYQADLNNEKLDKLIDQVKALNKAITEDKSLGKGFCIGHSYFCEQKVCTDEWLDSIVNYEILPMLSEYWFDDAASLQDWEKNLRGALK